MLHAQASSCSAITGRIPGVANRRTETMSAGLIGGTQARRLLIGVTSFWPVSTGFCLSAASFVGWGTLWPVFSPSAFRSSPSPAVLSIGMSCFPSPDCLDALRHVILGVVDQGADPVESDGHNQTALELDRPILSGGVLLPIFPAHDDSGR